MDFFKKYAYIILGAVFVLVLGGLFVVGQGGLNTNPRRGGVVDTGRPLQNPDVDTIEVFHELPILQETQAADFGQATEQHAHTTEPTMITVHIVGAVHSPGVYILPYGARVNDVLELAGGNTQDADLTRVNLAAFLQDAMQVRIPTIYDEDEPPLILEQVSPSQASQEQVNPSQAVGSAIVDGVVNINLANLSELQTLPNIGPRRAQDIIDFREAHGGFSSVEELLNVTGIGDGIFNSIKDNVTVD